MARTALWAAALAAGCSPASGPPARPAAAAPTAAERIVNGSAAGACEFPATVLVSTAEGTCTGSLVAANIVLYASHCGDDVIHILFGVDALKLDAQGNVSVDQPTRQIEMPQGACHLIPGHQPAGLDYAYCKLPEAVTDVPLVPILMGCEASVLDQKTPVLIVGYGQDGHGTYGKKRYGQTTAQRGADNHVAIDAGGAGLCFGDSGGPAFVRLAAGGPPGVAGDDTWRVFGVASSISGTVCGGSGVTDLMSTAVPWVESDSGVDITPCTDANGAWAPGPDCGLFPTDLLAVAGDGRTAACQLTARQAGASATCGAPYAAPTPTVVIDRPAEGAQPAAGSAGTVVGSATLAAGGGQLQVTASLDGQPLAAVAATQAPAFAFGPVTWTAGDHVLEVVATGAAGNRASARRTLSVPPPAAAPASDPGEGGPAAAPIIETTRAAGCAAAPASLWAAGAAVLLLRAARRPRRQVPPAAPPAARRPRVASAPMLARAYCRCFCRQGCQRSRHGRSSR